MKKSAKPLLCSLLIAGILLTACGCKEEPTGETPLYPPEKNLYLILKEDGYGVLNTNGEFVLQGIKDDLFFIRDSFTGEPKYLQSRKEIAVPYFDYDEEGNKIEGTYEQTVYTLYDTKGTLLAEESAQSYHAAFGDYLDCEEQGQHNIKNMKTGKTVLAAAAKDFIDDRIVMEGVVDGQPQVWIYSKDMKLLQTAPVGYYYGGGYKDKGKLYYNLRNTEPSTGRELYYIFDEDFHLQYHHPHHNMFCLNNGYLISQNDSFDFTVTNLATGETILTRDKDHGVYYYDGNMMITGEHIDGTLAYPYNQENSRWEITYLQTPEQNQTFSYLQIMSPFDDSYHLDNNKFYIYGKKENGDEVALDENGNIISQCETEGDTYTLLDGDGNILLTTPKDCDPPLYTGATKFFTVVHRGETSYQDRVDLFTADGTQIPLDEKYQHASVVTCYGDGKGKQRKDCIRAGYFTPDSEYYYSVLDMEGNPIVEDVAIAPFCDYCVEPNSDGYRMLVMKDGYQGMMDMEGNWLYREPITSPNMPTE